MRPDDQITERNPPYVDTVSSQTEAKRNIYALLKLSCHRGVTWFAGLFYLPTPVRLSRGCPGSISIERFKSHGAATVLAHDHWRGRSVGLGAAMLAAPRLPDHGVAADQLILVLALIAYHMFCYG